MPMVLMPLDGGTPIPLEKAIVLFGRGPECDIVLRDSRKVSRKHCCIAQIDRHFLVRDLGSLNGVRVNRRTVEHEARLKPGDELWVGDMGFKFLAVDDPGRAPRNVPAAAVAPAAPRELDPRYASLDLPVVLPDEDVDFAVESSRAQPAIPSAEIQLIDESEDGA